MRSQSEEAFADEPDDATPATPTAAPRQNLSQSQQAFADMDEGADHPFDPWEFGRNVVTSLKSGLTENAKDVAGVGEAAWSGITSGVGSLADTLHGEDPGTYNYSYQPKTDTGQAINRTGGGIMDAAGRVLYDDVVGPAVEAWGGNPEAARQTLAERLPQLFGSLGVVAPLAELPHSFPKLNTPLGDVPGLLKKPPTVIPPKPPTPQEVINQASTSQSMGAAATPIDATKLTPETQAELVRAHQAGEPINPTAIERHAKAQALPIPEHITRGMAADDSQLISQERNSRKTNPEIGDRYEHLNQAHIDNIDEMRREHAPQVVGNDIVQHSQNLVDSLKTIGDQRDAAITSAYNEAKALGGNRLSMDGVTLHDNLTAVLDDPEVTEFLPADVKKTVIDRLAAKGVDMNLDDFLIGQKVIGRAQRAAEASAEGGKALHALNKVRDVWESAQPAPGTATAAKTAYANASKLAKANFDDLKVNPAYRAAYNDRAITATGETTDLSKNFAQTHILGGSPANLARLRAMFKDDPVANETMTAVALDRLRQGAGINPLFTKGEFSPHGYNSVYAREIAPRAKQLLQDPQLIEQTKNLGEVASWQEPSKKSGYLAFSNTPVELSAEAPESAAAAAGQSALGAAGEAAASYMAPGATSALKAGKAYFSTKAKNAALADEAAAKAAAEAKRQEFIRETIKPGAGLTYHKPAR